jgi:hypothetical protein
MTNPKSAGEASWIGRQLEDGKRVSGLVMNSYES